MGNYENYWATSNYVCITAIKSFLKKFLAMYRLPALKYNEGRWDCDILLKCTFDIMQQMFGINSFCEGTCRHTTGSTFFDIGFKRQLWYGRNCRKKGKLLSTHTFNIYITVNIRFWCRPYTYSYVIHLVYTGYHFSLSILTYGTMCTTILYVYHNWFT